MHDTTHESNDFIDLNLQRVRKPPARRFTFIFRYNKFKFSENGIGVIIDFF